MIEVTQIMSSEINLIYSKEYLVVNWSERYINIVKLPIGTQWGNLKFELLNLHLESKIVYYRNQSKTSSKIETKKVPT